MLILAAFGEQAQRGADQGTGLGEFRRSQLQPFAEGDSLGARHQHTEGDGLRIAICETLVGCVRKEQSAPVGGQRGKGFTLETKLFGYFISQQPAKTGGGMGEIARTARRNRLPAQEVFKERLQAGRWSKFGPRGLNVTVQMKHGANEFSILPETESIAVCIKEVGKRTQPFPLTFVVRVFELSGVTAFAGSLEFNETDESFLNRDSVIGAGFQVANRRLPDRYDTVFGETRERSHVEKQLLERGANLILRLACCRRISQLCLRCCPEVGNRRIYRPLHRFDGLELSEDTPL